MKSVSPLSERLSLSAANPHIPGEIAESTAMKFISHMAASVPPNHNLDWQFNPVLQRPLPSPHPGFPNHSPSLTKLPHLLPPPSVSLIALRHPHPPCHPKLIRTSKKQLTMPTLITVMVVRELVTWFLSTAPSSQPPSSTSTFCMWDLKNKMGWSLDGRHGVRVSLNWLTNGWSYMVIRL